MERALIYLRVSTDRQAEKGISIPSQKEKCLEYAQNNNYEVNETADIYTDKGESARTTNRPDFLRLWERCRQDKTIRAIIFYDISRLARDRIDFALVKQDLVKRGIKICSVTENINNTPSGQLLEGVLSTVAEFYSLQSGEKISTGLEYKARNGCHPTGAPYGYKNVQEAIGSLKSKRWIEVDEKEAPWLQKAFQIYAARKYSLLGLVEILNEQGIKTRQGKKIRTGFLHRVFTNKFYAGIITWKGKEYKGTHKLIIAPELFITVNDILKERNGGGDRSQKHCFPLKGLIYCDICGSKYTGEQHRIKNDSIVRYLRCIKKINGKRTICNEKYFKEQDISQQFEGLFKLIQLPGSFIKKLKERVKKVFQSEQELYEKARESALNQLEALKNRKKKLILRFLDKANNASDEEMFATIKQEFEIEEKRLNEQLNKTEGSIKKTVDVLEIAIVLANNCYRAYKKATPDLQGLLAKAFFEKVVVRNGQIVTAILNPPIDYLCKNRIKNHLVFKLLEPCGDGGNRTRV